MKNLKEKFLSYFGKLKTEEGVTTENKLIYRSKTKFNFYIEVFVNNFTNKEPIHTYFLVYKNEFHLKLNDLNNDLLIVTDFSNEKYFYLLNAGAKDILKHFRNKKLKERLEKRLQIKNIDTKVVKI